MKQLEKFLPVGIIQTTLNCDNAWSCKGKEVPHMNVYTEKAVMEEIRHAFKGFYQLGRSAPRIVLIPEYSIPHNGLKTVEKYAKAIDAVVIGGCYMFVVGEQVQNKAVIIIPKQWPKVGRTYASENFYFGKKYFAEQELEFFKNTELEGCPENTTYILDAGIYGNIGVAICADFYDLERFLIYKGKVHHLMIVAYNRDYKSFEFLAEAISRLLLCNVVVCNTGHYGDSLVYSPYTKEYKRTIFKAAGAHLFVSQVVHLPVKELDENQEAAHQRYQRGGEKSEKESEFKWPPGYEKFGSEK